MVEQFFFNAVLMFISPEKPAQEPVNSLFSSFFKKVLEDFASWIAGFFAILVVLILLWIFSRMRRSKICISVVSEGIDRIDVNRIYIALAKKNNLLRYLLEALPPLWLSTLSDVKLNQLFQNTNLDRETINLKLGPAEIQQAEKFFYRFFLRGPIYKLYFIRINGECSISMESKKGVVFHQELANLEEDLEQTVIRALAIASTRSGVDAEANQELVVGLLTMSKFFIAPFKIEYLFNAIENFDRASRCESLKFQAQFLALCALQLSQSKPQETQERTARIQELPSIPKRYRQIITYQRALSEFYTYKLEGYKKAVGLFSEMKEPNFFSRLGAWLGFLTQKRKLLIYLLAQANMAVALAHIRPPDKECQRSLNKQLDATLKNTNQCINKFPYSRLGVALTDVRWRILNVSVAYAYNHKESDEDVIAKAQEALLIAPYALAVRANLGTLMIFEALKDEKKSDEYFKQALEIFTDLVKTGWDPGYVHFRLTQLYRRKGDFKAAQKHLDIAMDPEVRDVFNHLNQEVKLVKKKDTHFSKENI